MSPPRTSSTTSTAGEVRDDATFDNDYRQLKREHTNAFQHLVREKFAPACEAYAEDPPAAWPAALRVKSVRSAPGILEMTWSFASPDGRATF
jgi:hypothetical protein